VSDKEVGEAILPLEVEHEVKDLYADGDIKHRGWVVDYNDLGEV